MSVSKKIGITLLVCLVLFVSLVVTMMALTATGHIPAPVSAATADISSETKQYELAMVGHSTKQQVITHLGYTVSYNPMWKIPNWVAYELTSSETRGEVPRVNGFLPDPQVRGTRVVHKDYSNSGFDRGHMAPAGDMKWSEQAMRESFYTTNICPQNRNLNAGDWKSLEEQARDWAQRYGNVYIACGPIVSDNYTTIGRNCRIVVPEAFYKVFMRKKRSGWTTIGFVFPNKAGSRPLMTYMHTVDEVEKLTGIDFFYLLPDSIESQVEADFNVIDWTF